jgi:hypothetical protein
VNIDTEEETKVCAACVGGERFKKWIIDNGKIDICSFDVEHGEDNYVVPISRFAVEVDSFFRENYGLGEVVRRYEGESDTPSYEEQGEPYQQILAEEIQCDDEIVEALADHLPDSDPQDGDPFYDETRNYENLVEAEKREQDRFEDYWYESNFQLQWSEFCWIVQNERRFFKIKEPLDQLFGEPEEYEAGEIKPVYRLPVGQKIYRARLLDQKEVRHALRTNPANTLSAPPKEKAVAGRMNVELIPAFYAAFSDETAVAEIRPGIGEEVAIAEYVLQKELKVFDFTVFDEALRNGGDRSTAHTRYEFISQMQEEISKPIQSSDRLREYIPTQIVSEYLKEYFDCDAVIYRSSMIKERDKESRNVVLLNRGKEFIGESESALAYNGHTIKIVSNLTYDLIDEVSF